MKLLDVVVPMSGVMRFFEGDAYPFPKPLVEICGKPMVAYLAENLGSLKSLNRVHFLVREDFCKKFHLDETLRLLLPDAANVISVCADTAGALCTTLLSVDHLSSKNSLLITNFDQFFSADFGKLVEQLLDSRFDGGVAVFDAVHPRWSYVRVKGEIVQEAAEKRPISRSAIAGLYAFSRTEDFLVAAFSAVRNLCSSDDPIFVSAVLNEMILMGRTLRAVPVSQNSYHSFYSSQRVDDFLRGR